MSDAECVDRVAPTTTTTSHDPTGRDSVLPRNEADQILSHRSVVERELVMIDAFPGGLTSDTHRRGDSGPRNSPVPKLVHTSTKVCLDVERRSCYAQDFVEQFVR
jgi:hypothetical protein